MFTEIPKAVADAAAPEEESKPARRGADERALRKRLARAEFLLGVTHKVATLKSLDQVFSAIVDIAVEKLNAERGSIFLHDANTGELYSRVAQGTLQREIRMLSNIGVAGYVFTHGEPEIIHDAYADPRFNQAIDQQTGFVTHSMLCVPMSTVKGEVIGIAQVLNKKKGRFTREDLSLLQDLATQSSHALQAVRFVEEMQVRRQREMEFLNVVTEVTRDIKLGSLLQKVMQEVTRMLDADRATLFLNDEKNQRAVVAGRPGPRRAEIRFPNHLGIAGAVFTQRPDHQHSLRLRRPALQPGVRQEDRLLHALHHLRPDGQQERQDHRRDPGAEQARRTVHRRRTSRG